MLGGNPGDPVDHADLLGVHVITHVVKSEILMLVIDDHAIWFTHQEAFVPCAGGEQWGFDEDGQRRRYTSVGYRCVPRYQTRFGWEVMMVPPIVVEIRGTCSHTPELKHMCEHDMYYGINERTGDLVFEAGTIIKTTVDHSWRVIDEVPACYSRWHPVGYVAPWMKPDHSSRWQPSPGY